MHHFHRAAGRSQFFNFARIRRTVVQLLGLWYELVWKGGSKRDVAPVPAAADAPAEKVEASRDAR